ncbi:hypothetical protein, partial [Leptospira sarikeiensis]
MTQTIFQVIEIFQNICVGIALLILFFGYFWIVTACFQIHWGWGLISIPLSCIIIIPIAIHWKQLKGPVLFLLCLIPLLGISFFGNELIYSIYSEDEPVAVNIEELYKGKYPDSFFIKIGPHKNIYTESFGELDEKNSKIKEGTKFYYPLGLKKRTLNKEDFATPILLLGQGIYGEIDNADKDQNTDHSYGMIKKRGDTLSKEIKDYYRENFPEIDINNV